jgi:hypothetical protein
MNVGNTCPLKSALGPFVSNHLFVILSNLDLAVCMLPVRNGFFLPCQVNNNN